MPNIFEYFDYHKYLLDFYNERKKTEGFFSYRFMGQRLGIHAGYLVKVLQGKKNIATETARPFRSEGLIIRSTISSNREQEHI